jgi:hypothetical protein
MAIRSRRTLRELHVVHDPDKGEAVVTVVYEVGDGKHVRSTVEARYGREEDEPRVRLEQVYNMPRGVVLGLLSPLPEEARVKVALDCEMPVVFVREEVLGPLIRPAVLGVYEGEKPLDPETRKFCTGEETRGG